MASPDDALLAPARWEGKRCTFDQVLERIDEPTRAKVAAAGNDPQVPNRNIELYITGILGYAPSGAQIRRHQVRGCKCPKP